MDLSFMVKMAKQNLTVDDVLEIKWFEKKWQLKYKNLTHERLNEIMRVTSNLTKVLGSISNLDMQQR
jgi:hypothetical protein